MSQVAKRSFRCFQILKVSDGFKPMDYKLVLKGEHLKNRYAFGILCTDDIKVEVCSNPEQVVKAITRRFEDYIIPDLYSTSLMQWDGAIDPEDLYWNLIGIGPEASLKRLENRVLRVVEQLKSVVNK